MITKPKVLYSNIVGAKEQYEYLGKLETKELNSNKDYDSYILKKSRAQELGKDLRRNSKDMMILGYKAPEYKSSDQKDPGEAILEYKKTLIAFLQEKNIPEDQCDRLASMMINLNNQGLYAGLASITSPLLLRSPFLPTSSSYKVSLRAKDKKYLIYTQYYTHIAHVENSEEKLTTLNINYSFDLNDKTMQFEVEDTENYSAQDEGFKEIFDSIYEGMIGASQNNGKTTKDSLFASSEFDLKKAKTENNRNSHMRAGLYMLGSLLLVVLYVYNKINSGNNRTEEHPPQDYTNSTHINWIDATRAAKSIVQNPQK